MKDDSSNRAQQVVAVAILLMTLCGMLSDISGCFRVGRYLARAFALLNAESDVPRYFRVGCSSTMWTRHDVGCRGTVETLQRARGVI